MKILKNILTFLLVLALAGFFVVSSFSFGENQKIVSKKAIDNGVVPSLVSIGKKDNGDAYIEKKPYLSSSEFTTDKGQVGHIEFGLLATSFVLPNQSGSLDFGHYRLSGSSLIFDSSYPAVFSLYDPFTLYSLVSVNNDFILNEITNGSFYVGTESDNTVSIYSIDAVIRLDFLFEGKKMSDMVLFPGMYIRFDPKMNSSLEGANLFRILQSLQPDGTQEISVDNTGIEFVNPRMESTGDKDSFFMYKLPLRTNILFQMLHVLFYDKVSQIDLLKEYGASANSMSLSTSSDSWLQNPGKKSHFLLLKLDSILASALDDKLSIDTFRSQLSVINEGAHTLAVGNDIQLRLEDFLTDGRFALFGGTRNSQFTEIYQAISDEVGKTPVTAHAKLLQRLSDIYSKNLVAQKKDFQFSRIDIYAPTALELENTLASTDIEQRDYFDIALYAFNVLKKNENKSLFVDGAVYEHSTYSLIKTILVSTDRYVKSIPEADRKSVTYQGIALHFYEHMLGILARSVYHTFMEDQDGYIYLKPAFRPTTTDPKIHIEASIIRDIQDIAGVLSSTSKTLKEQYGESSKNNTYLSIEKSINLFYGFAKILDYESYNEYVKLPYVSDISSETVIPRYTSSGTLESASPIEKIQFEGVAQVDPSVELIMGILGNIPKTDIIRDGDYYRINNTQYQFSDKKTGDKLSIGVSLVFDSSIERFDSIIIQYNGQNISLLTDKKKSSELTSILGKLPDYVSRYNAVTAGNPSLTGEIRFLETTQKIVIGVYPFPLVP